QEDFCCHTCVRIKSAFLVLFCTVCTHTLGVSVNSLGRPQKPLEVRACTRWSRSTPFFSSCTKKPFEGLSPVTVGSLELEASPEPHPKIEAK
ncbi:hypothetical protein B0H13DRAFT_2148645, partial [Mycena leptocephala]